MVTSQEAVETIINFLENNITDPQGRTTKWIYDDTPLASLSLNNFPRIGVIAQNSSKDPARVGSTDRYEVHSIDIIIKTGNEQKVTVGGTTYRDVQLRDKIGKDVETAIKNNPDHFRSNGIIELLPVQENNEYDERRNPTRQIILEAKTIN